MQERRPFIAALFFLIAGAECLKWGLSENVECIKLEYLYRNETHQISTPSYKQVIERSLKPCGMTAWKLALNQKLNRPLPPECHINQEPAYITKAVIRKEMKYSMGIRRVVSGTSCADSNIRCKAGYRLNDNRTSCGALPRSTAETTEAKTTAVSVGSTAQTTLDPSVTTSAPRWGHSLTWPGNHVLCLSIIYNYREVSRPVLKTTYKQETAQVLKPCELTAWNIKLRKQFGRPLPAECDIDQDPVYMPGTITKTHQGYAMETVKELESRSCHPRNMKCATGYMLNKNRDSCILSDGRVNTSSWILPQFGRTTKYQSATRWITTTPGISTTFNLRDYIDWVNKQLQGGGGDDVVG